MRNSSTLPVGVTAILFTGASLFAQDLTPKAAAQSQPIFLHNGVIHTVSGATHVGGGVVFAKGKILRVVAKNASVTLPEGTRKIDLQGSHVYPGLITVQTSLGLTEIGSVPMSNDTREVGDITPEVQANIGVNPDSTAIPVARSNGILVAGVFPSGGLISGRASAMSTDGWTWQDMTLVDDVGLVIQWPRRDADKAIERLDKFFAKARAWHKAKQADQRVETDVRLRAMVPALTRQTRVFIHANDLDSITGAVLWGTRNELDIVIVGGRDAGLCTELLKRHDVEVIVSGTHSTPKRRDSHYDERFSLPKKLAAAGLKWCMGSGGRFANERNLPYHAASAVAFGLSEDEAIKSITLYAARTLGIEDRVGSIAEGRDATLIVTNGSPLDLTTLVETAFIEGRQVRLHNKHRALAAKYREKYRQLRRR